MDALALLLLGLLLSKAAGIAAKRVGLNKLSGYLFAGIAVGYFFSKYTNIPGLGLLAELSAIFVVFYSGFTTNYRAVVGEIKEAGLVSISAVLACLSSAAFAAYYIFNLDLPTSIIVAILLSNTATEITSMAIAEFPRKLRSFLIAASFVDDIIVLFLASLFYSMMLNVNVINTVIGGTLSMALFALIIRGKELRGALSSVFYYMSKGSDVFADISLIVLYGLLVIYGVLSANYLLAAYIAGLLISMGTSTGDPMLRYLPRILEFSTIIGSVLEGVFVPLFFIHVGLTFKYSYVDIPLSIALGTLAIFGKLLVYTIYAHKFRKLAPRLSLAVGISMNGRGVLDVTLLAIGLKLGIISTRIFNSLLAATLYTIVVAIVFSAALGKGGRWTA